MNTTEEYIRKVKEDARRQENEEIPSLEELKKKTEAEQKVYSEGLAVSLMVIFFLLAMTLGLKLLGTVYPCFEDF